MVQAMMNQLIPAYAGKSIALIAEPDERAELRFLEFFTANIPSPHARRGVRRLRTMPTSRHLLLVAELGIF
jgi:hypothetical protein